MKYFIIAGEPSGDLHAANLMAQLKKQDSEADFAFFGGSNMLAQGGKIIKHYRELAFMGFGEVALNIRTIYRNFDLAKQSLMDYNPDAVILVDYPGFNLRMAKFAKKKGYKTFYYISPKIWAWKQKRGWKIKKYIDRMFVVFPFEIGFYKKFKYDVSYPGNPILDEIEKRKPKLPNRAEFITENDLDPEKPIVALLPGSRKQEIQHILPTMVAFAAENPTFQYVLAASRSLPRSYYELFIKHTDIKLFYNRTYSILKNADLGIVTSGTATLEAALFNMPQVVVYHTSMINYLIAKQFIKITYISLVNIIMERPIVREMIQADYNKEDLSEEVERMVYDLEYKERMINNYGKLQKTLGNKGASERTAKAIIQILNSNDPKSK